MHPLLIFIQLHTTVILLALLSLYFINVPSYQLMIILYTVCKSTPNEHIVSHHHVYRMVMISLIMACLAMRQTFCSLFSQCYAAICKDTQVAEVYCLLVAGELASLQNYCHYVNKWLYESPSLVKFSKHIWKGTILSFAVA